MMRFVSLVCLVMSAVCLSFAVSSCHEAVSPKPANASESAYLVETMACVHKSKTRDESRECRALVDAKWLDAGKVVRDE